MGGNTQELIIGSRRNASGGHRDNRGPRPPPWDESGSARQPLEVESSADLVSQGFDKIMARFDKLEFRLESTDHRVENLDAPDSPDPDPPYYSMSRPMILIAVVVTLWGMSRTMSPGFSTTALVSVVGMVGHFVGISEIPMAALGDLHIARRCMTQAVPIRYPDNARVGISRKGVIIRNGTVNFRAIINQRAGIPLCSSHNFLHPDLISKAISI